MLPFVLAAVGGYLVYDSFGKYEEGGLIAPNGNKSNLTPEQYKLVRTPEFKAWFGDWENDSENASKVVDENGEPLICYHGTKRIFTKFKEGKYLGEEDAGDDLNFFTTNYATTISDYDGWITYPCFLKIVHPLKRMTSTPERSIMNEVKNGLKTDGFIISSKLLQRPALNQETWLAVPKSNQIKLATEPIIKPTLKNKKFIEKVKKTFQNHNITFDGNNPDIRYKQGGRVWNDEDLLKRYEEGESIGFSAISHLKSKGLIKRADGTKRKSMK